MKTELPGAIRDRFPLLDNTVYTASCSQGALSTDVRSAYESYLADWDEKGAPWGLWVEKTEMIRDRFARLIGATTDEIAVTTSVSAGVSSLLSGLAHRQPGSTIVMTDFEFPTIGQNVHAQELAGITVRHVPEHDDVSIPLEKIAESIDGNTSLVAITHVCFRNGALSDIAEVIELAHAHGAKVLVDSFQAVGAVPIDVRELNVDFLAGGTLKYLLGSAGLGFLYCRSDLVEDIVPLQTGWFADKDIFEMDIHDYSPSPTARRFESGTPPIPNIYAGIAGIDLMMEVGIAETADHVASLVDRLVDGLDRIGAKIATPRDPQRRGPMVAVKATDADALAEKLQQERIVTSPRGPNLRLSWHCYNSFEDVDAVVDALERHRSFLA